MTLIILFSLSAANAFDSKSLNDYILRTRRDNNIDTIEAIRHFCRTNSIHGSTTVEYVDPYNTVDRMVNSSMLKTQKISIWCGQIAYAMNAILHKFGYTTRMIRVGGILPSGLFADHIVIEVYNKKTNKYELHDPDYDIHYISSIDRKRLSAEELYQNKQITYRAIPERRNNASWDLNVPNELYAVFGKSTSQITIRNSLLAGGFYCAAEVQGKAIIYFNEKMLDNYNNKDAFKKWFYDTSTKIN